MNLTATLYRDILPAIDAIVNQKLEALPKVKGFGRVMIEEELNDLNTLVVHLEAIFKKADELLIAQHTEKKRAECRIGQYLQLHNEAAIEAEKSEFNRLYFSAKANSSPAKWPALRQRLELLKAEVQEVINAHQNQIHYEKA